MTLDFCLAKHYWEILAGALIAQHNDYGFTTTGSHWAQDRADLEYLLKWQGLRLDDSDVAKELRFDDYCGPNAWPVADESYVEGLAKTSGVPYTSGMPLLKMPEGCHSDGKSIVLAYGGVHADFNLPVTVWRAFLRQCKTYSDKVIMVGSGERPDMALMESELLFDVPLEEKMHALANASLIVGPVNDWTWIASAYRKKLAILYPDTQPMKKWFPFANKNFGRVLVEREKIDATRLIASLRLLIAML